MRISPRPAARSPTTSGAQHWHLAGCLWWLRRSSGRPTHGQLANQRPDNHTGPPCDPQPHLREVAPRTPGHSQMQGKAGVNRSHNSNTLETTRCQITPARPAQPAAATERRLWAHKERARLAQRVEGAAEGACGTPPALGEPGRAPVLASGRREQEGPSGAEGMRRVGAPLCDAVMVGTRHSTLVKRH